MSEQLKFTAGNFAEYLQSVVQLNTLEKMTQDLDKELNDSQNVMMEIKALYNIASLVQEKQPLAENGTSQQEDISNFLDATVPNLLMPDMAVKTLDAANIDEIVASIKAYVEVLKNNLSVPNTQELKPKEFKKLDIELYAQNLDQLNKRLMNIKITQKDGLKNRNLELEKKLTQLCDDVNNFTKMIEAKTALSNSNKKLERKEINTLQYDNMISKLLSSVNELTYILQKKH